MFNLRKVAAASVTGIVLTLGAVACEQQHPQEIPGTAQMVQAGNQQTVYTATQRGMVYVYDQNAHRLIWSGEVSEGKQINIDPQKNQVTVNGMVVSKGTLTPYHNEQVWFVPSSSNGLVDNNNNVTPTNGTVSPQPAY
jgi:hypothetical protein